MKKKLFATLMSAMMVASLFTGCGSSAGSSDSASSSGSDASADDVQEITWMFWDDLDATQDLISLGYKENVERFNKDYEGKYHVNVVTTNLEEYYDKLNALVAANQTPDVFIVSPGFNIKW